MVHAPRHPLLTSFPSPPRVSGINNNGDLPEEFLKKLYTSIVTYEIRLSDDDLISTLHHLVDGISHVWVMRD